MHKDAAKTEIEKRMASGESLIGFFTAHMRPPFWLFFLIGPLAAFGVKVYFVGVTNHGVHFHKLSLLGKFSQHDFLRSMRLETLRLAKGFCKYQCDIPLPMGKY